MFIPKIIFFTIFLFSFLSLSSANVFAQNLLNSEEKIVSDALERDASGIPHVHLSDAQNILNSFSHDGDIPFRYPADGCYARAHLMVLKLREMGIPSRKVLIQGRLRPAMGEKWNYHIAPLIETEEHGEKQWRVIDPSLNGAPLLESEWVDLNQPEGKFYYRRVTWHRYTPGIFTYVLSTQETASVHEDLQYYKRKTIVKKTQRAGETKASSP